MGSFNKYQSKEEAILLAMQPRIQRLGMGCFTMRARLMFLLLLLLGPAAAALLAVMTSTDVNVMTFNDDM